VDWAQFLAAMKQLEAGWVPADCKGAPPNPSVHLTRAATRVSVEARSPTRPEQVT
jgi:hypothetical protein